MIVKIIAVILGIIALLLTFRVEWMLEKFFGNEEPSMEDKLKVKSAAAVIAVIAFAAVLIFN